MLIWLQLAPQGQSNVTLTLSALCANETRLERPGIACHQTYALGVFLVCVYGNFGHLHVCRAT